jgi:hypothetical protein
MIKLLVDDLGQIRGAKECPRGQRGIVEYGTHTRDGFVVEGRASLCSPSDYGWSTLHPGEDCGRRIAVGATKAEQNATLTLWD